MSFIHILQRISLTFTSLYLNIIKREVRGWACLVRSYHFWAFVKIRPAPPRAENEISALFFSGKRAEISELEMERGKTILVKESKVEKKEMYSTKMGQFVYFRRTVRKSSSWTLEIPRVSSLLDQKGAICQMVDKSLKTPF